MIRVTYLGIRVVTVNRIVTMIRVVAVNRIVTVIRVTYLKCHRSIQQRIILNRTNEIISLSLLNHFF